MNSQSILRISAATALIAGILFLLLHVLRLTFIFKIIHPFLVLNVAALIGIAAVGLYHWRTLAITRLEGLMVGALLLSVVFANYAGREPFHIITDVLRPLLFVAVVITLRQCLNMQAFSASPTIRKLLPACVWATLAGVVICTVVDAFVKGIYPAYSSIDSVLGMGWLLATGGAAGPLLFLLLLVASGKRAVVLAAAFVMVIVYRKRPNVMLATLAIIMWALSFSTLSANYYASQFQSPSQVDIITEYYSGGRLDEMRDAIAAVPSPAHYITGMGPGFAYPSQFFTAQGGGLHRNLHFTPLSLIIYYGVIFSGLFAFYIVRMLPAAWRALNDKTNPVRMSYTVYFFASLPFALIEFSVFAYANFAIACGVMMASDRQCASPRPYEST